MTRNALIDDVALGWQGCGVRVGDTLMLHSSASRTLRRMKQVYPAATPGDLLESFLRAVGNDNGTLLLPLFNFDFAHGAAFELRTTPSQMGALSEAGRRHPASVRTEHPIYSFAVIGRYAARFHGVRNFSGYGADSPFAILRELDGKIAVLDLPDQHSMTFYHHVEELHEVPYRYHKAFTSSYTDWDGVEVEATFGLFVRKLELGVETHVDPMGEVLWQRGLYTGDRPHEGSGLRVIGARSLYDAVSEVIREGRAEGLLYRIAGKGS